MDYRELEKALGYVFPDFRDEDGTDAAAAADPEILRRLSQNDPDIIQLMVACYDDRIANNRNWAKEVGLAISQSTHLRSIMIEVENRYYYDSDGDDAVADDPPPPFGVPSFFMELAENRSIKDLFLDGFNHSHMDVFKTLAPFFERNHNLRSISMDHNAQLRKMIPSLVSALVKTAGLKYIGISNTHVEDSIASDLINALRSMPGLHHLVVLDLGWNKIGQQGCRALRNLLRHPACKIQRLSIDNNHLDNACMGILCGGLVLNTSIKFIDIHSQKFVTASGWGVFFDLFPNSVCTLERIDANQNDIGDDGVISLGDSLATSRNMRRIYLRSSQSITPLGWQGFANGLRSPDCSLLELDISECEINDEGALTVASALGKNTSLEELDMSGNRNISSSGWIDCFHILRQNEICLKQLDLSDNNIDDEGARMLATILVKMSALESFSLWEMTSVSLVGWQIFADVLKPRSLSKLRVLNIGPLIDDSVIICFADALIGNTSLTNLPYYASEVGRLALANSLCNDSSLINTFLSNHTLKSISFAANGDLKSLLAMNKCENKFEVARRKILATHFGDVDACVRTIFAPMPTPTLPTALSWIGRDRREYSMMYHFLHSMPWTWLLESTAIASTE